MIAGVWSHWQLLLGGDFYQASLSFLTPGGTSIEPKCGKNHKTSEKFFFFLLKILSFFMMHFTSKHTLKTKCTNTTNRKTANIKGD